MKVNTQNIPAECVDDYKGSLRESAQWQNNLFGSFKFGHRYFGTGSDIYAVRKRQPFRLPTKQGLTAPWASIGQVKVRRAFRRCVNAFGGAETYLNEQDKWGIGPASRANWYGWAEATGEWYYNYFISIMWWGMKRFKPLTYACFNRFRDTYIGWGTLGDPDTNYEGEGLLYCDHDPMSNPPYWRGGRATLLKIKPSYDRYLYDMAFSMFRLYAWNCKRRIYIYEVEDFDADTVTWNTMPSIKQLLGVWDLSIDGPRWINIILQWFGQMNPEEDILLPGRAPLDKAGIQAIMLYPMMWKITSPVWQDVGFNASSREADSDKHAVICP